MNAEIFERHQHRLSVIIRNEKDSNGIITDEAGTLVDIAQWACRMCDAGLVLIREHSRSAKSGLMKFPVFIGSDQGMNSTSGQSTLLEWIAGVMKEVIASKNFTCEVQSDPREEESRYRNPSVRWLVFTAL